MDYLVKIGIFAAWLSALYYMIDVLIIPLTLKLPFACFLDKFDIPNILNFYLSSLLSCFITKKILAFWQSA